jgi:hypothetical protein
VLEARQAYAGFEQADQALALASELVRARRDAEGSAKDPSAVLTIPLTPNGRWFTRVEYVGANTRGKESDTNMLFVDVGLHHLIHPNVEAGGVVAFGPHRGRLNLVTNFGIGVRF